MNKWSEFERQHNKIEGSWEHASFNDVVRFMQSQCRSKKLPVPVQMLPPEWRAKVGDEEYSEMWLKVYSLARTLWRCFTMSSDYANRATEEYHTIVETGQRDLELLLAHAKMQQECRPVVKVNEVSYEV